MVCAGIPTNVSVVMQIDSLDLYRLVESDQQHCYRAREAEFQLISDICVHRSKEVQFSFLLRVLLTP
jgi:hypothetical protein